MKLLSGNGEAPGRGISTLLPVARRPDIAPRRIQQTRPTRLPLSSSMTTEGNPHGHAGDVIGAMTEKGRALKTSSIWALSIPSDDRLVISAMVRDRIRDLAIDVHALRDHGTCRETEAASPAGSWRIRRPATPAVASGEGPVARRQVPRQFRDAPDADHNAKTGWNRPTCPQTPIIACFMNPVMPTPPLCERFVAESRRGHDQTPATIGHGLARDPEIPTKAG